MVLRSALNNWINGNRVQMDKSDLIGVALYYENAYRYGIDDAESNVEEDVEEY